MQIVRTKEGFTINLKCKTLAKSRRSQQRYGSHKSPLRSPHLNRSKHHNTDLSVLHEEQRSMGVTMHHYATSDYSSNHFNFKGSDHESKSGGEDRQRNHQYSAKLERLRSRSRSQDNQIVKSSGEYRGHHRKLMTERMMTQRIEHKNLNGAEISDFGRRDRSRSQ